MVHLIKWFSNLNYDKMVSSKGNTSVLGNPAIEYSNSKMNLSKLSPKILIGILLALFFAVALCLRVYFPYDKVFSDDWIKFTGNDAYYEMHLVDNLVRNLSGLYGTQTYPGRTSH